MYTEITQEEKDAYKQSGTIKRGYIDIVPLLNEETISLNEYDIKDFNIIDDIYTPGEGFIGSVISKQLTINLFKPSDLDLENREVDVYIGVDVLDNDSYISKYIPYGRYIIQKPENELQNDRTSFEAFDYMVKFNKTFVDTLLYPCQAKDVLNAICEQCGVDYTYISFPNDDFSIESNQFVNGEKCRDVLRALCQLSGTYAKIGRDNKLYLIFLNNNNNNIEEFDETDYNNDIKINNEYGPVNRLVLKMSQVEGENVTVQDNASIEENGLTELIISDNPFTYTQILRELAIDAVWQKVKGLKYVDYEMKPIARPYMDSGDPLSIKNNDKYYYSYLFTNELNYHGGIDSNMSATADTKTETKYAFIPQLTGSVKRTEILVDKANQEIKSIVEEQNQFSKKLSSNTIKVNEVETKVLGVYDFTKIVKAKNQIILDDALDTNILNLKIYAETIFGIYPKKTLFPSKTLFPKKGGSAITIVVSKVSKGDYFPLIFPKKGLFPKKTLRPRSNPALRKEYVINLTRPLLKYGEVKDVLEIYYDENIGTCVAKTLRYLQKVGENIIILSKPEEEIVKYLNLKLNKGKNYIYLKNSYDWTLEANYIFNTELNKYYATKVESYTKIKETEDTINFEVSKKVDNDEIISAINLSPEEIQIKASNINFNGAVSANENFKILADGSMKAKNGTFSGDIYLSDGGKVLGGNGLYTNLQFNSTDVSQGQNFGGFTYVGFQPDEMNNRNSVAPVCIDANIPDNFTIKRAYVSITHIPLSVNTSAGYIGYGYIKNMKLYSSDINSLGSVGFNVLSNYIPPDTATGTEISNSFKGDTNSYTPKSDITSSVSSEDISNSLSVGSNRILIKSSDSVPAYSADYENNYKNCALQSGFVFAQLNVFGYIKTKEEE